MAFSSSSVGTAHIYTQARCMQLGSTGKECKASRCLISSERQLRRPVLSRRRLLSKNCTCRIHSSIQRERKDIPYPGLEARPTTK